MTTLISLWIFCFYAELCCFHSGGSPLYPFVASDRPEQSVFCGPEITKVSKEIKFRDWSDLLRNKAFLSLLDLELWHCKSKTIHRKCQPATKAMLKKRLPKLWEITSGGIRWNTDLCLSLRIISLPVMWDNGLILGLKLFVLDLYQLQWKQIWVI